VICTKDAPGCTIDSGLSDFSEWPNPIVGTKAVGLKKPPPSAAPSFVEAVPLNQLGVEFGNQRVNHEG